MPIIHTTTTTTTNQDLNQNSYTNAIGVPYATVVIPTPFEENKLVLDDALSQKTAKFVAG